MSLRAGRILLLSLYFSRLAMYHAFSDVSKLHCLATLLCFNITRVNTDLIPLIFRTFDIAIPVTLPLSLH